jgi:hypothetical protein
MGFALMLFLIIVFMPVLRPLFWLIIGLARFIVAFVLLVFLISQIQLALGL